MCLDLSENKIESYWFICQISCCCCQIEGTFGHSDGNSEGILLSTALENFTEFLFFVIFRAAFVGAFISGIKTCIIDIIPVVNIGCDKK